MLLIKISISSLDHIPCFHLWPENRNDQLITEVKVSKTARTEGSENMTLITAINKEKSNFSYLNKLEYQTDVISELINNP